jgi:hypothetical protein
MGGAMSFRGWEKGPLVLPDGTTTQAIFPAIVSASRATDIPAFYAEWFAHRLRAGYAKWINRFNPNQIQYVAFRDTRVFVFWSKNPAPLLPHLDELDRRGIHFYFQFTLNDYEAEGYEPGVPPLAQRVDTFRRLAGQIGPDRVIWRFDPLLLTAALDVPQLLDRIARLGERLRPFTRKLVFSYADIGTYRGVTGRMQRHGVPYAEFTTDTMRTFAEGLAALNRNWGLQLATCAEAIELADLGIAHNRCIDDDLMIRLWPDDAALMHFLGCRPGVTSAPARPSLKDPGQRTHCGCTASKDIGRYGTCPHGCLYCYANGRKNEALRAVRARNPLSETM